MLFFTSLLFVSLRENGCAFVSLREILVSLLMLLSLFASHAAEPYNCCQTASPKFIDGRFNDWTESFITLNRWDWRAVEGKKPVYGGPFDLSATVRLAWDKTYLYLAIAVVDDVFRPAKEPPFDTGDAVLLRIAPLDWQADQPANCFDLLLTPAPTAGVYLHEINGKYSPMADAKLGLVRANLPLPSVPIAHEEGKESDPNITKLWYECALPWEGLPKIPLEIGECFGLEIQVRDDDGQGIRGSLLWRGGRGGARTAAGLGKVQLRITNY